MSRKLIIVAAGRGKRLGTETDDIPKCMVKVAGRSIMEWQLRAFAGSAVDDVVVVRGYRGDRIAPASADRPLRFVDNPTWQTNNILASLLHAAHEMAGGFYFSYSDIVFAPAVAARLERAITAVAAGADASLVIDRRWDEAYVGRTEHPVSEAELARVHETPRGLEVAQVGKRAVPREDAVGEFIGLAHFSAAGAATLRAVWDDALRAGGLDAPFGRAAALRQAYLTDALNAMIARGARVVPVFIDGQWREIDTGQDLAGAEGAAMAWS